jgi:hypothetical protein
MKTAWSRASSLYELYELAAGLVGMTEAQGKVENPVQPKELDTYCDSFQRGPSS